MESMAKKEVNFREESLKIRPNTVKLVTELSNKRYKSLVKKYASMNPYELVVSYRPSFFNFNKKCFIRPRENLIMVHDKIFKSNEDIFQNCNILNSSSIYEVGLLYRGYPPTHFKLLEVDNDTIVYLTLSFL